MGEIWGRNGRETAVAEWRWAQEPFLNVSSPVRASRPGCFAYPDMLSIGASVMLETNWIPKGCPRLRIEEERTLFATWAIVSSPLILSFDITDDKEVARLWP